MLDEFDERVLIGEIYLPVERLVAYYGTTSTARICRSISPCITDALERARDSPADHEYEAALPAGAWPNWVLGNHDRPRIASRVGPAQARVAAMLLLTLRGTPTLYYGDEIGMTQDVQSRRHEVQDPCEQQRTRAQPGRDPAAARPCSGPELGPTQASRRRDPGCRSAADYANYLRRIVQWADRRLDVVPCIAALLALRRERTTG